MDDDATAKRPRSCLAASQFMACLFAVNWALLALLIGLGVYVELGGVVSRNMSFVLLGGGGLGAILTAGICCVVLVGWLRLIHADVRDATGGRHEVSPRQAAWPMCVPVWNIFWLQSTLAKLAATIWSGCHAVGARCADVRRVRRLIVAMMSCLLSCLGLLLLCVLFWVNLVKLANWLLAAFIARMCLFAASVAFLAASVVLMIVAGVLSRDVDRLHRTRRRIDPNAVVPVETREKG